MLFIQETLDTAFWCLFKGFGQQFNFVDPAEDRQQHIQPHTVIFHQLGQVHPESDSCDTRS